MRLIDLYERNQQVTGYAYHGTSDVLLDTILSNGMDPTPTNRVYDGDVDGGNGSVASMDGTYLSVDKSRAMLYANNAVNKLGGHPMVVTIQYTKNSEGIDEDDVYDWINYIIVSNPDADADDWTTKYHYEDAIDDLLEQLRNGELIDSFVQAFHKKFRVSDKADTNHIKALFSLIGDKSYARDFVNYAPFMWVKELYKRDPSAWKELRNHLGQILNNTGRGRESDKHDTFRINRPIGFRGKTRIVAISSTDTKNPKVYYGKEPK
jgi:hypothetical protein